MAVQTSASDEAKSESCNVSHNSDVNAVVDEKKWDAMLQILGSLIAFKNRADALGWRDAFENMPVYLEVRNNMIRCKDAKITVLMCDLHYCYVGMQTRVYLPTQSLSVWGPWPLSLHTFLTPPLTSPH